jgi:septal ring factor EnvC (AmiA/AmiB activator)
MPSNLLDNLSWNFIKESASQPSVRSFILSVEEKLKALKPSTTSDSDRIATALRDLKEVKKHVNRIEEELEQEKNDHKELKFRYEKLKSKAKASKEE